MSSLARLASIPTRSTRSQILRRQTRGHRRDRPPDGASQNRSLAVIVTVRIGLAERTSPKVGEVTLVSTARPCTVFRRLLALICRVSDPVVRPSSEEA